MAATAALGRLKRTLVVAILLAGALGLIAIRPAATEATAAPHGAIPEEQTPAVQVTAFPTSAMVNQPVTVGYSLSSLSFGLIGNVNWLWGDNTNQLVPANQAAQHTFQLAGTYNIMMQGTDAAGNRIQGTTTILVQPAPTGEVTAGTGGTVSAGGPIASAPATSALAPSNVAFASAPTTGRAGTPLTFSAANATSPTACGSISGYTFNFGDSTPSMSGQIQSHTYTAPGTYTVSLTATDCSGTTAVITRTVAIAASAPGTVATYSTGWNLVAGPAGTALSGASGSLYTLQAGDTTYETADGGSPLKAGVGYWAYFPLASVGALATASSGTTTVQLPAGQGVMIGNPSNAVAMVTGADQVLVFEPAANGYIQSTTLQPGQGAWAFSSAGGTATISGGP